MNACIILDNSDLNRSLPSGSRHMVWVQTSRTGLTGSDAFRWTLCTGWQDFREPGNILCWNIGALQACSLRRRQWQPRLFSGCKHVGAGSGDPAEPEFYRLDVYTVNTERHGPNEDAGILEANCRKWREMWIFPGKFLHPEISPVNSWRIFKANMILFQHL